MDSDDDRQSGKTLGAGQTDIYSRVAQSAEQVAVNDEVVSPSLTSGARAGLDCNKATCFLMTVL